MFHLGEKFSLAQREGHLYFYESESYSREVDGVKFVIRYCPALQRKHSKVKKSLPAYQPEANPFLPPDPHLLITKVGCNYNLLFNKYCVVPEHLLLVTGEFIAQEAPLTLDDFSACSETLEVLKDDSKGGEGWLFFYNSGINSGASQPHRHFQLIHGATPPIMASFNDHQSRISALESCIYGFKRLESVGDLATQWMNLYTFLRRTILPTPETSYNLLFTASWILLVPRQAGHYDKMSFNALAFAGYLLAVYPEHLDVLLNQVNPIHVLGSLGFPSPPSSLSF